VVTAVLKSPAAILLLAFFLTGGPWKSFLAAVLFHELGHCLAAYLVKVPLRNLQSCGGGLHLDFAMETVSYSRELAVLTGGSVCGLLTVLCIRQPAYRSCALCLNLANLLPLPGTDGGGILFCLLHRLLDGDLADRVCRLVYFAAAFFLWLGGMWIALRVGPNPVWMLCGMAALIQTVKR